MRMSDSELISRALTLWANHIETGSVVLSAADQRHRNQCLPTREQNALPQLSSEQLHLVQRLRALSLQSSPCLVGRPGGLSAPRI